MYKTKEEEKNTTTKFVCWVRSYSPVIPEIIYKLLLLEFYYVNF